MTLVRYTIILCAFITLSCGSEKPNPSNIIFFIDDLAYSDVGCYGSEYYETPNVYRLAAEV